MLDRNRGVIKVSVVTFSVIILLALVASLSYLFNGGRFSFSGDELKAKDDSVSTSTSVASIPEFVVTHVNTPDSVKAIYLTAPTTGSRSMQDRIFSYIDGTDINSVVIDVKDYSGRVSFLTDVPNISDIDSPQNMIPDIERTVDAFHKKGIYVIARVAAFQDSFAAIARPEWAISDSATGKQWKDSSGVYWLDPTNKEVWDYIVAIGMEAYRVGFDEINFDYIRFPTDGKVSRTVYSDLGTSTKRAVINDFFSYLRSNFNVKGIPISGDIFGQVTSDPGDMGIGQLFEDAIANFDFVYPMVYPSHYINGFLGFDNPADHPYEIIKYSMDRAVSRAIAASTSPSKIRPWIQAFDYKAKYTPDMVKEQMLATYDAGLTGWLIWNAGSVYDKSYLSDTSESELVKVVVRPISAASINSATSSRSINSIR